MSNPRQRLLARNAISRRSPTFDVLRKLGLTPGLQFCLDAGDAASFASGQSWLDRSGNGQDFFVGLNGSATASDPTFTGTAGRLSSGEYFACDGGDYFTYDTANETWMESLHKDSALFSFACWMYPAGSAANGLFGTLGNSASNHGAQLLCNTSNGNVSYQVGNGSGTLALNASSNLGAVAGAWQFFAVMVNEAESRVVRMRNLTAAETSSAYGSPSSSAATSVFGVGQLGGGSTPLPNGGRIAFAAAWTGERTVKQMRDFYALTSPRLLSA